jgi:16S rRNA A1518/A1519 N6-dimethyltransferase RsmA/KsgA/DIM1 with predicted DNA glycosylase/AP lyase activity
LPENYFDEDVAARYDEETTGFDPEVLNPTVDFLAALAHGGAALELGIGTGRVAVPLAQRGVPVHGIDLSTAMVARLRAKPEAKDIAVTIGDFATTKHAYRHRRVRRREPGADLASLHAARWQVRVLVGSFPLRLAVGARPDGADRRPDAA